MTSLLTNSTKTLNVYTPDQDIHHSGHHPHKKVLPTITRFFNQSFPPQDSNSEDSMDDPLSPFQPSNGSSEAAKRGPSTIARPLPKTDLDFLQKVAADPTAGTLFWDKSSKAQHMAPSSSSVMAAATERARKAASAFKEAGRRGKMKEELSQFVSDTSFTPLVLIHNASSWLRRIGWIMVFLTMMVWMTIQCYWLLDKFFSYPMEVKLDLQAAKVLEFPSVTICNLNPIKSSSLYHYYGFESIMHYADQIKGDDMLYDFYYDNFDWTAHYSTTWFPGFWPTGFSGSTSATGIATPWGSTAAQGSGSNAGAGADPTSSTGNPVPTSSTANPVPTSSTANPVPTSSTANPVPTSSTANPVPTSSTGNPVPTSSTANPVPTSSTANPVPTSMSRKKRDVGSTGNKNPSSNQIVSSDSANNDPHASSKPPDSALFPDIDFKQLIVNSNVQSLNSDTDGEDSDASVSADDYPISDTAEMADWTDLEDLFGEDVHPKQRFRRSPMDDATKREMMQNSSFNKWDALSDSNMDSYYETRGMEYQAAMVYATVTAQMDEEVVRRSGHQLNDLLLSCSFNGWYCSPKNFSYFHSHKFGNCYTFNSPESESMAKTKFPGPDFGLTLEMYIEQNEYVPALAAEAGVRVQIHPRGSTPFPEDEGVSIAPGLSTSISIRLGEVIRLEPPHGTCSYDGSGTDLYASTLNMTYSKQSCLKSCYQSISRRHCDCAVPMYIIPPGATVCNMTDPAVDDCTSMLPDTVPEEYEKCDEKCPQPCYEVDYDMLVSSAAWPSQNYQNYLQTKVTQSNYLLMGTSYLQDFDFVKLNVYYTDLMYQKIEQQQAYESQNLISDIGGQLGLWLGLSAITIGELCGLILALFRSFTSTVSPAPDNVNNNSDLRLTDMDDDVMAADVKARSHV